MHKNGINWYFTKMYVIIKWQNRNLKIKLFKTISVSFIATYGYASVKM